MEILNRVVKTTEARLRDEDGCPSSGLNFYLISKDGRHAGVTLRCPEEDSITDENGTRH